MSSLDQRQRKIQERRKSTPFRTFIKEFASGVSLSYYRNNGAISIYPESDRIKTLVTPDIFEELRDNLPYIDPNVSTSFFDQYYLLQKKVPLPTLNWVGNCENVGYSWGIINSKNCYLSHTVVADAENILYSFNIKDNTNQVIKEPLKN